MHQVYNIKKKPDACRFDLNQTKSEWDGLQSVLPGDRLKSVATCLNLVWLDLENQLQRELHYTRIACKHSDFADCPALHE